MSDSVRAADDPEPGADAVHVKDCPAPLAAEDFYYENGLIVFTAAYHLKRGSCCNSGCRHCPFR